jgi:hypothetical protein
MKTTPNTSHSQAGPGVAPSGLKLAARKTTPARMYKIAENFRLFLGFGWCIVFLLLGS